ncbi:Sec-independent protein translocase protein TatB [Enterovirga aerilata]|uniref:Sec-independent protein translocase protein TatB n=1 Tax=Enterovirga aerilata TaxID=2730920 RepID=A0A849I448_9HYPH|nr:Sec-independent protein translocase protein TatB [Enterovirga sp. DB1703]NNM72111.1 twin-arginine translocase subunit TatB [Enterovirga sp. DB1703]
MFDMSWGEVMVIGAVALIVIGPKDLPKALRTVGQMTAKVRRLASEFQGQFNEAMREAELDEVRREVEGINRQVSSATSGAFNPIQTIRDELKTAVEAKTASYEADAGAAGAAPVAAVEEAGPIPQIGPMPEPALPPPDPVVPIPPELTGPGLEPAPAETPAAANAPEPAPLKSAQA